MAETESASIDADTVDEAVEAIKGDRSGPILGGEKSRAQQAAEASAEGGDDRLAYQGLFQRLFIRPEIGAMIGAIGIWVFFWAVSVTLGTANGASNVLDVAATLGIMAVAVSLLMIGGEFDLSSGANTGAMGMLVIMLVKETGDLGGAGLNYWIAIPLSFAVALGIGWLNGWMVERTALPSFIVTLATFFALRGLKLGLAKRIVDNIQVGRADEGAGYGFWQPIFAAEWDRTAHQLGARDLIYTITCVGGILLVMWAVYELQFARRENANSSGIVMFVAGLAGIVAGILVLHNTDNVAGNWIGAVVIAVGAVAAVIGVGTWHFAPQDDRGSISITPAVAQPLGAGIGALVIAAVLAIVMDAYNKDSLFFPFTVQGLRATLILAFVGFGMTAILVAIHRARAVSPMTRTALVLLNAVILAGGGFFVQWQSQSEKFRSEAFSVIMAIALATLCWGVAGFLFQQREAKEESADVFGNRLLTAGSAAFAIGMIIKLLYTVDAEIAAGIAPAKFSMRIVWFVGFTVVMAWVLARTRFGSWTFAVGGNKQASRQVGVPAARTKTQLFMIVAGAAWLVGILLAFRLNTIQAGTGDGLEFQYIIAAVVGGTLLTGGYGTVIGGAIGAVIMAMSSLGIPNSRWESDWYFLFMGVILLLAVIANRFIRTRAEALR